MCLELCQDHTPQDQGIIVCLECQDHTPQDQVSAGEIQIVKFKYSLDQTTLMEHTPAHEEP